MILEVTVKVSERQTIKAIYEGKDIQECTLKAGALLAYQGQCDLCGSKDIRLQTRITKEKGYKYTEFVCNGCQAKQSVGLNQDIDGTYLKKWEPKYEGNQAEYDPR